MKRKGRGNPALPFCVKKKSEIRVAILVSLAKKITLTLLNIRDGFIWKSSGWAGLMLFNVKKMRFMHCGVYLLIIY